MVESTQTAAGPGRPRPVPADADGAALDPNFPPHVLREYSLLADGERGAVIGPRGDVVWMCAPRWHSDAVFSALIGGAGTYSVTPVDTFVWGGYYEDGTLIWRSRWTTTSGTIECREALAMPTTPGRLVLLRRIVAVSGDADVEVLFNPRAGFGYHPLEDVALRDGRWVGRTGSLHVRWSGARDARPRAGGELAARIRVPAGGHHDLVLEVADGTLADAPIDPGTAWENTAYAWSTTVPRCDDTIAPKDARHAYAVMRGLTSAGGGMVAAATMSLPERAEQGRDYDYRYVWIRDQALTGQAIAASGAHPLLDDAVRFVSARLLDDGPQLVPAYTVDGGSVPDQRPLQLPGYPGGYDIVGNHVNAQFQLDSFGEALLMLAAAAGHDHLDADGWRAAEVAVAAIGDRWNDKDAGIWELDDHHWTESRLICVAGLRAITAAGAPRGKSGDWLGLAERILAETTTHATHRTGRWQRATDDEGLDAALLLPALRGAIDPRDPRTEATVTALAESLAEDHFLYRFRHQSGELGDAEGAFLLCGFAMAMAQHQRGDDVEAARWFERNRAACGPPGLFSEEYDVAQRQMRGNLPQAFVHALMFEASVWLAGPSGTRGVGGTGGGR